MPIARIQLPDGRIGRFEVPEGTTPEQAQQLITGQMDSLLPTEQAPTQDTGFFDMAGRAVTRGLKQTGSLLGDVLPAMVGRAVGADEYAARQMQEAEETQKEIQQKYAPRYGQLSDVQGIGDVLPFIAETALEQVPNLATAIIPGVGGAVTGGRLAAQQAAKTALAREASEEAAKRYAAMAATKGAQRGGLGGAFLGSYALNAPEIFQNIYQETKDEATGEGQMELGASLLAGSVSAALDSILPAYLVRQFTPGMKMGVVEKVLERSGMQPGLARSAAAGAVTGFATEAPTEATQEAISIAAEKFVQENPEIWGSKEFNRLIEAGVRGGVGGGAISGVAGGVKGFMEGRPAPTAEPTPAAGPSALDQLDAGEIEEITPALQPEVTPPAAAPSPVTQAAAPVEEEAAPAPAPTPELREVQSQIAEIRGAIKDLETHGADETVLADWYAERERLEAIERAMRRGEVAPEPSEILRAAPVETKDVKVYERGAFTRERDKDGFPQGSVYFTEIAPNKPLYENFYEDFPQFSKGSMDGAVFVHSFNVAKERGKGIGRKLLNSTLEWADQNQKPIFLVPAAQPDAAFGGLTQEQLKAWYARNGFEEQPNGAMVRMPQPSEILRAPSARDEAMRMLGKTDEELQAKREEMGLPGQTFKPTEYEKTLTSRSLMDAGLSRTQAESIIKQIENNKLVGPSKGLLNRVLRGQVKFPEGWRVPTEKDIAAANEVTKARYARAQALAANAPQQRLLAQQLGLDLAPAEEGVSRELASPIAMSEQEFQLTAPEGQVPPEAEIETEAAPAAAPINLVDKTTNRLETFLNSLQPSVQAEQGVQNYKASISNFLDEIKQYLETDQKEARQENLALINDFFNRLSLTSNKQLAEGIVADIKGKPAQQQAEILAQRTRMPNLTTPVGIGQLRDMFQDFMEQQSVARLGEFPGAAATKTFASDIYIPAQVANIIRQLRSKSEKSMTQEERAFMAYMSKWKYGLAMRSAAYDLANQVPMGDMFSGQGAKAAQAFQRFVEENFPAQIYEAFNETIAEYGKAKQRAARAAELISSRQKRRKEYLAQVAEDVAEFESTRAAEIRKSLFNAASPSAYFKPMHPAIEERIADSDLDGALELIEKFPGARYWQLLAKRLRALNLNTATKFDEQERLIRMDLAGIANTVEGLVTDIQMAYPDVFDKHIAPAINEAGEINPARFAKGLKAIKDGNLLGGNISRSTQVNWVLERYDDAVKSLEAPGFYMLKDDVINLNRNVGGNSYYAFFHELVHASTARAIRNPDKLDKAQKQALDNLNDLYAYTLENYPAVAEYGFQNLDEFIAEAFSNADFQALLNRLPYKNGESSLWSKFIEYVRRLLGGKDTVLFGTLANADILMSAAQSMPAGSNKYTGTLRASATKNKRTTAGTYKTAPDVELSKRWLDILKNRPTWEQSKSGVSRMLENVTDTTRKHYLGAFTLRQLQDLVGTRLGNSARNFIESVEGMLEEHNKIINESKEVLDKWTRYQSKSPAENEKLSLLMIDTTLAGIDPDRTPGKDAELDRRWADLDDQGKAIYREVRDFYKRRIESYKATTLRNIELSLIAQAKTPQEIQATLRQVTREFDKDSIEPYFPLQRFGQYWLQVGKGADKEFYMFDSAAARNTAKDQLTIELSQKGDSRTVYEGNSLRDIRTRSLQDAEMLSTIEKIVDEAAKDDPIMNSQYASAKHGADTLREAIKDGLEELYILTLPSKSIRKNFLNRKGVSGASKDMLRAFAENSNHMAYQHARFKYSRQMFQQLDGAESTLKLNAESGKPDTKVDLDYLNELKRRLEYVMNPTDTGTIPTTLSNVSFMWYLTAPASALVNMLGVPAIGFPVLAARFGKSKSAAALLSYSKKFMSSGVKDKDGNWSMPSLDKLNLSPEERAAYEVFTSSGLIDITQAYDIAGLAESASNAYTSRMSTVMRGMSFMFHHAERFNREVMAMSAFRMAYDKAIEAKLPQSVAFAKAIDQAKDLTYRAMFDYSTLNKPRFLQNAYAKVILQFKQFPQQMTYLLVNSGMQWFSKDNPQLRDEISEYLRLEYSRYDQDFPNDPAEQKKLIDAEIARVQKEGRDRLLGTLGMTFLFAGASGLPLFSVGSAVIEAVYSVFADDDEPPLDFENWFKNWTARTFGDFWGDSISRGVFTQATGMNFADRMSLNDLWFRDARKSQDEVTAFQNMIINLLGPTAALGISGAEAVKLFNDGYTYRGMEKLLPAVFKQPMVGARYATEGVLTLKGDELVSGEEISAKDALSQSLGFAPEKVSQRQKANIDMKSAEQEIISKRQDLMNAFFMAFDTNDADFSDKVLDKIDRFNQMYPSYPIKASSLTRSIKTRYKARALAELTGGIPINKNLIGELEDMGYYGNLD